MAQVGNGTLLKYCDEEDGTFTTLAGVTSAPIPDRSSSKIDVTAYDSPDNHVQSIPGEWIETGDLEIELIYSAAVAGVVRELENVPMFWRIVLKTGEYFALPGFITKIGGAIPNRDKITMKITIAVSGANEFVIPS